MIFVINQILLLFHIIFLVIIGKAVRNAKLDRVDRCTAIYTLFFICFKGFEFIEMLSKIIGGKPNYGRFYKYGIISLVANMIFICWSSFLIRSCRDLKCWTKDNHKTGELFVCIGGGYGFDSRVTFKECQEDADHHKELD